MSERPLPSIPGYTLNTQLYAGGCTVVYQAIDEHDGKSVVIKVLRSHSPSVHELVRFRTQYTIAKNLDSPGIVTPLALVPWHHSHALVMEDVGGISLRDHVQAHGCFSVEQIMNIALQLSDSLHHLNQHRVLHKDINPANILIRPKTDQVWLTDFSLASQLPKESQELKSPGALEGTLAYIAPEQTGRMNRGIDFRADFYGLGVTLYELLTGLLPFQSNDPMELIHCHLAKVPIPPREVISNSLSSPIPQPLSDIVLKLMAKNAEDRYQSALGLKYDLQRCFDQWKESNDSEPFELGQQDRCDRFLIPDKLYGREAEIQTLMDAFGRVSQGASELMLVAGFSGVGKTAVVNEIHKPITQHKGYFIKGKCDQFNRNVPFSAFVQAFRDLMKQLLGEADAQLQRWKAKILESLGENGQVLIEVIPELTLIIGPQPEVPELSGIATQNRFNRLFGQFIQVLTSPEHPLTIFLDDLQWIDSASLTLLKLLMAQAETGANTGYLLILGAYRDNEVTASHPLMLTLDELSNRTVHTLSLEPLTEKDIHQLVAESLHCSVAISAPLAELVYQKTRGNSFFANQFLQGLQADGWITFNADVGHWQCDLSQVRPLALTDDVVEFMVSRLQQWPETTQNALAIAACLGNQFELGTLSILREQSPEALAQDLWPALQTGLLIPGNETYKFFQRSDVSLTNQPTISHDVTVTYRFLHDRVQQAAYTFIPEDEQQQTHARIGQFLLDHLPPENQADNIFDIVNQLNIGRDLVSDADERHKLISLNLQAGLKAKSATAYGAALDYFDIALVMLSEEGWQHNYPLALELHENAAEVAALDGNGERMEALVQTVTTQAETSLDMVTALQVKMQYCLGQNQPLKSIEIARSLLKELEFVLPASPTMEDIQWSLEKLKQFSTQFSFDEIVALPVLKDPEKLAIIGTLILLISPTMITNPVLFLWVTLAINKISLENGNSPYSPYGYSTYAILLKNLEDDLNAAYAWGNLSLTLLQNSETTLLGNRVYQSAGAFTIQCKQHLEETLTVLNRSYTAGLEQGDFEFSGYALMVKCYNLYFLGRDLSEVTQEILKANEALSELRQKLPLSWNQCCYQTVIKLSNTEEDADHLAKDSFDADIYIQSKQEQGDAFGLCYFYVNQAILRYTLGDYSQALAAAKLVKQYLAPQAGMMTEVVFYFYDSLIHLACINELEDTEVLAQVKNNQQKMKCWADNAPMNFQHKYELVYAEELRILGDRLAAMECYDHAIAGAKENKYVQDEALANELAANFYLDWGKEKIAAVYIQEAYFCYERWGAKAKTDDLVKHFESLLRPLLQQTNSIDPLATLHNMTPLNWSVHSSVTNSQSTSSSSSSTINAALDLATILKSAQVLSKSTDLNELLERLASIMLQTSGAERLLLLLPSYGDANLQVRVIATPETVQLVSSPLKESTCLPVQLIQYVQRTREILVLDGVNNELPVVDPFLQQHSHASMLYLPLLQQNKLVGLLYLEHQSVAGVFNRDRITILNFLCTQAAISLENALLNQELERKLEIQTGKREVSEARFHNMVNNIPGVVFQARFTADGVVSFTYISPDCEDLWEVSAEAILSGQCNPRDFDHPEDRPIIDQKIAEAGQTAQQFDQEFRMVTPSGKLKWIHITLQPTQTLPDGSILWDGLVMDMSDRKRQEQEILESKAFLQTVLDTFPLSVFWKDRDSSYIGINQNFARDAGLSKPQDIVGLTDFDMPWAETEAEAYRADDQEVIQSGSPKLGIIETRVQTDGSKIWVETNKLPLHDLDGNVIGVMGTYQDISDRKKAELELQRTNAELMRATQHKSEFLANMSHELRTPLNAVLGFSQLMQSDHSISHKHHEKLATINRNGEYLLALINDILEMSKIEAGKITFNPKQVDLNQLLDEVRATFEVKAKSKNLAFKVTSTSEIPRYLQIDAVKLRQILLNLLSNAYKFTQAGQISFRTQVLDIVHDSLHKKAHLQFTVSDTGPGIEADELENIFEPFKQSTSGRQHHQGTGLGLPISRKFAQMMGGNIQVDSTLGQGSTFSCDIYAQVLSAHKVDEIQPHRYQNVQGLKNQQQTYRLLIVDDNPDNRALLSQMLSISGFEVRHVINGVQAVAMNESWQPHLICMDIHMPQMGGLEATRQIRQSGLTPKIIAISASAFVDDQQSSLAAGCDAFMAKPFTVNKIFEHIASLLDLEFTQAPLPIESLLNIASQESMESLIKEGFCMMSVDWQKQLQLASSSLDECSIQQLLLEVPSEYQGMVDAISSLVKDFRFDILVKILEDT